MPAAVQSPERRVAPRLPSRRKTPFRLVSVAEHGRWSALLRNVSVEGLGLTVNRRVSAGAFLTLQLPIGTDGKLLSRLVQVKHAREQTAGGWWVVGATFLKPLSRQDLDNLRLRAPSLVPPSERRTASRHSTRVKVPCPLICVTERGPWHAAVRNASCSGVSLIVTRAFSTGAMLSMALPGLKKRLAVMRVTHSRSQPGKRWWVLGGSFLQPLSTEELTQLL